MKSIVITTVFFSLFFSQKTNAQNKINQDSLTLQIAQNQLKIDSIQKIIDYQKSLREPLQPQALPQIVPYPSSGSLQFYDEHQRKTILILTEEEYRRKIGEIGFKVICN